MSKGTSKKYTKKADTSDDSSPEPEVVKNKNEQTKEEKIARNRPHWKTEEFACHTETQVIYAITYLQKPFMISNKLTKLELQCNLIRNDGTEALVNGLKYNSSLTFLDLRNNMIEDSGVMHLALALAQNSSITSINLSGNKIGPAGGTALGDALKTNSTLLSLNIGCNKLEDMGVISLATALRNMTLFTTRSPSLSPRNEGSVDERSETFSSLFRSETAFLRNSDLFSKGKKSTANTGELPPRCTTESMPARVPTSLWALISPRYSDPTGSIKSKSNTNTSQKEKEETPRLEASSTQDSRGRASPRPHLLKKKITSTFDTKNAKSPIPTESSRNSIIDLKFSKKEKEKKKPDEEEPKALKSSRSTDSILKKKKRNSSLPSTKNRPSIASSSGEPRLTSSSGEPPLASSSGEPLLSSSSVVTFTSTSGSISKILETPVRSVSEFSDVDEKEEFGPGGLSIPREPVISVLPTISEKSDQKKLDNIPSTNPPQDSARQRHSRSTSPRGHTRKPKGRRMSALPSISTQTPSLLEVHKAKSLKFPLTKKPTEVESSTLELTIPNLATVHPTEPEILSSDGISRKNSEPTTVSTTDEKFCKITLPHPDITPPTEIEESTQTNEKNPERTGFGDLTFIFSETGSQPGSGGENMESAAIFSETGKTDSRSQNSESVVSRTNSTAESRVFSGAVSSIDSAVVSSLESWSTISGPVSRATSTEYGGVSSAEYGTAFSGSVSRAASTMEYGAISSAEYGTTVSGSVSRAASTMEYGAISGPVSRAISSGEYGAISGPVSRAASSAEYGAVSGSVSRAGSVVVELMGPISRVGSVVVEPQTPGGKSDLDTENQVEISEKKKEIKKPKKKENDSLKKNYGGDLPVVYSTPEIPILPILKINTKEDPIQDIKSNEESVLPNSAQDSTKIVKSHSGSIVRGSRLSSRKGKYSDRSGNDSNLEPKKKKTRTPGRSRKGSLTIDAEKISQKSSARFPRDPPRDEGVPDSESPTFALKSNKLVRKDFVKSPREGDPPLGVPVKKKSSQKKRKNSLILNLEASNSGTDILQSTNILNNTSDPETSGETTIRGSSLRVPPLNLPKYVQPEPSTLSQCCLTSLYLDGNNIKDVGAKALADSLKQCSSLKLLDIRNNKIQDGGAKSIASALLYNSSLTSLYLNVNKIGTKEVMGRRGDKALLDAVKKNTTLTTLELYGNIMNHDVIDAIKVEIDKNKDEGKLADKKNKQSTEKQRKV